MASDEIAQKSPRRLTPILAGGFSSPTCFAKCFREHFGYSPKELKNGEAECRHGKMI
jgi:transcriptional regulator GlxA family with amidase domain